MERWTASAKWAEGPALSGQCGTPLALSLTEWLGVDEAIVFSMRTKPKPMTAIASRYAEYPVVQANSSAVEPTATEELELERRVGWIGLEQFEILVCKSADFRRQRFMAAPEPGRGRVIHNARRGCVLWSISASASSASSFPADTSASSSRSQATESKSANQRRNSANAEGGRACTAASRALMSGMFASVKSWGGIVPQPRSGACFRRLTFEVSWRQRRGVLDSKRKMGRRPSA